MTDPAFEPLLSSDETEALLHAMRSNSASTTGAREVDLGSPDSLLRSAQTHAESMVREFAAESRGIMRRLMGSSQVVKEGVVDITPFNVFAASIVPGSAIAVLGGEEGVAGLLVVGAELTHRVLKKKLGAPVQVSADAPAETPRPFLSSVDRRILRPFIEEILRAFSRAWGAALSLTIIELPARAAELPRVPQFESLLRIPVVANLTLDTTDEVGFFLTAKAARLPKASEPAKKPDLISSGDRRRMAAQLSRAEVELVAVLGRAQSSIREVLSLEVGSLIRLDEAPETPIVVTVEGQKKLIGSPVVHHGNLAIAVQKVLGGTP
jgi:flagellar motor switch protein FliM